MKITLKTGRKEGFVSSWNLFFDNGLRLQTIDLTFRSTDEVDETFTQFCEIVEVLRAAGFEIDGEMVRR